MNDRLLGPVVPDFNPPPFPSDLHLAGRFARLDPLQLSDADGVWQVFRSAPWVFDYLSEPAPATAQDCAALIAAIVTKTDSPAYCVRAAGADAPLGYITFYTNSPAVGCTEIGNVNLSPDLQRTPIATEAFFLMLDWAFGAGYRRVEWKCTSLNGPSRRAAQRLGFSYEGLFRQHLIVKSRNRDTAWFGMTDGDWMNLRPAFTDWLSTDNFDSHGQQRQSLRHLTQPHLVNRDPTF